jgi:hypothetical protein
MGKVSRKRRREAARQGSSEAAAGGPPTPLVGSIDLATLMEFEAKTPGTRVCTCELDEEARQLTESNQVWAGGEHLVTVVPETGGVVHTHYYPDRKTRTIIFLKIENVEPPTDVPSTDTGL